MTDKPQRSGWYLKTNINELDYLFDETGYSKGNKDARGIRLPSFHPIDLGSSKERYFSSLVITGPPGMGKTILALNILSKMSLHYYGAESNQVLKKHNILDQQSLFGVYCSFEQNRDTIKNTAEAFGWTKNNEFIDVDQNLILRKERLAQKPSRTLILPKFLPRRQLGPLPGGEQIFIQRIQTIGKLLSELEQLDIRAEEGETSRQPAASPEHSLSEYQGKILATVFDSLNVFGDSPLSRDQLDLLLRTLQKHSMLAIFLVEKPLVITGSASDMMMSDIKYLADICLELDWMDIEGYKTKSMILTKSRNQRHVFGYHPYKIRAAEYEIKSPQFTESKTQISSVPALPPRTRDPGFVIYPSLDTQLARAYVLLGKDENLPAIDGTSLNKVIDDVIQDERSRNKIRDTLNNENVTTIEDISDNLSRLPEGTITQEQVKRIITKLNPKISTGICGLDYLIDPPPRTTLNELASSKWIESTPLDESSGAAPIGPKSEPTLFFRSNMLQALDAGSIKPFRLYLGRGTLTVTEDPLPTTIHQLRIDDIVYREEGKSLVAESGIRIGHCLALRGPRATHKLVIGFNFLLEALRQGESALLINLGNAIHVDKIAQSIRNKGGFNNPNLHLHKLTTHPSEATQQGGKARMADKVIINRYIISPKKQETPTAQLVILNFRPGKLLPQEFFDKIVDEIDLYHSFAESLRLTTSKKGSADEPTPSIAPFSRVLFNSTAHLALRYPLMVKEKLIIPALVDFFKIHDLTSMFIAVEQPGVDEMNEILCVAADIVVTTCHPGANDMKVEIDSMLLAPQSNEEHIMVFAENITGKRYIRQVGFIKINDDEPKKEVTIDVLEHRINPNQGRPTKTDPASEGGM